jgi:dTDP-4-dehydrorhamnose reductase
VTILLIGAGGLVGRHLRAALAHEPLVCTYRRTPEPGGRILDITDHTAVQRTIAEIGPTIVLVAAADAYVERCEREPLATRRVNVEAAGAIARASREAGALVVVFSSEYVFDGSAPEYREDDMRNPLNEYGRQKIALEDLVLGAGRGLVCRTSGVFGHEPSRKNFVCQLVDRLRSGQTFDVPSDQHITPSYAPSLASAVVALATAGHTGVFHVAGPRVIARVEFARMAAAAYGLRPEAIRPRPTSELGLAAARPLRCGLNVEKLAATLGHGLIDPAAGLREMAAEESS